jgi:hypothetical protein
MNYSNSKNPHIRRMAKIEAKHGLEMSDFDAKIAEEKGYKICTCGSKAWFKPTVGTWVCSCGMIFRLGEWRKRGG